MLEKDDNTTIIVSKVEIDEDESPVLNSRVHVIPKPVKTEYKQTLKILSRWKDTPEKFPVLNCILNSKTSGVFSEGLSASRKIMKALERNRFREIVKEWRTGTYYRINPSINY